jgi:hypothetical protein
MLLLLCVSLNMTQHELHRIIQLFVIQASNMRFS